MDVPDYHLPAAAVAQEGAEPRHAARLLVSIGPGHHPSHHVVGDLPDLLEPDDLLVVNTSRVIPARLRLRKATGGVAEVLLVEPEGEGDVDSPTWAALVRPGRRLPPGTVLRAGADDVVEVGAHLGHGRRRVRLLVEGRSVTELLAAIGTVPLPPYIRRPLSDPGRYQTVYADQPGSVAAPTAGLHLSTSVLERCRARGITISGVDLAVGAGTFRPVVAARAEDHVMHAERYRVPAATMAACRGARRVVAVGTTTLRALESAAATGELAGHTDLYIHGTYPFQVADLLLTNFHQPRSTLLLLLEAFCGPRWRELYRIALADGYRFLSFGDAMLVDRVTT